MRMDFLNFVCATGHMDLAMSPTMCPGDFQKSQLLPKRQRLHREDTTEKSGHEAKQQERAHWKQDSSSSNLGIN